jgi:hypothetical protein
LVDTDLLTGIHKVGNVFTSLEGTHFGFIVAFGSEGLVAGLKEERVRQEVKKTRGGTKAGGYQVENLAEGDTVADDGEELIRGLGLERRTNTETEVRTENRRGKQEKEKEKEKEHK